MRRRSRNRKGKIWTRRRLRMMRTMIVAGGGRRRRRNDLGDLLSTKPRWMMRWTRTTSGRRERRTLGLSRTRWRSLARRRGRLKIVVVAQICGTTRRMRLRSICGRSMRMNRGGSTLAMAGRK
uniref:(northern house mosquito) hypothetical protein n=1 Tax=Culex pipiens TaxID=7175 RepID=A0A8D8IES8_CULPI